MTADQVGHRLAIGCGCHRDRLAVAGKIDGGRIGCCGDQTAQRDRRIETAAFVEQEHRVDGLAAAFDGADEIQHFGDGGRHPRRNELGGHHAASAVLRPGQQAAQRSAHFGREGAENLGRDAVVHLRQHIGGAVLGHLGDQMHRARQRQERQHFGRRGEFGTVEHGDRAYVGHAAKLGSSGLGRQRLEHLDDIGNVEPALGGTGTGAHAGEEVVHHHHTFRPHDPGGRKASEN